MRKLTLLAALLALSSCAAPAIRLSTVYMVGERRTYSLTAVANISAVIGGGHRTSTTTLRARSVIEVLAQNGSSTRVALTLTPTRLTRDGKAAAPPAEEKAELVIGADGSIEQLISVGGLPPALSGVDIADVAPLFGAALPTARVHVGSTWNHRLSAPALQQQPGVPAPREQPATQPGFERGRLAALRRVHGYDCAVIALSSRRPLIRDREIGGQPVRLSGAESAQSQNLFAFRSGFPVSIQTVARAEYQIANASVSSGSITIDTDTQLELLTRQLG